ncbi:MAG: hypothetical protein J2P46_19915 [Zavarzinella sp.]|nr:hypothetical protein [Zavarzinella sp.]
MAVGSGGDRRCRYHPSPTRAICPSASTPATRRETIDRFGTGTARRKAASLRLERIYRVAEAVGHLARFVVYGSFITDKPEPNDVDVFLLMEDSLDASRLTGEAALLFDHPASQAHFGASVFWLRRLAAWEGEQAAVEYWRVKRGGGQRGIVEIVSEVP